MTLDSATAGLSRASLIEAIYRASRIVTESSYDFDSKATRLSHLRRKDREKVSEAVSEIVSEIEKSSAVKIGELPAERRAEVVTKLYRYLSDHVPPPSASEAEAEALLKDLHKSDA